MADNGSFDFDLDEVTDQAWRQFQGRLSEVISMIDETADLHIATVSADDTDVAPEVSFHRDVGDDDVRVEASGNAALSEEFRLSDEQIAQMVEVGWNPPTGGEQNFWVEDDQRDADRLAQLTVRALRDVYRVQHPVFLAPDLLAEILTPRDEPTGPPAEYDAREVTVTVPVNRKHLEELVQTELTRMLGHPPIRDESDSIAIRVGSTMVFLRTTEDAKEVSIFASLVHDLAGRSRAAEVLNDLNVEARWVKFQMVRDRVFLTYSMFAQPFVPAHLRQAMSMVSKLADSIDNELASKLGGRTTFEGDDGPR
ncbi:MAG: hypothetical protein CSB46_06015 [Micrococcales bacterium]|nr:MAG: hypothetical protein CSB46_06015 [Micrococcales bacterium]